MHAGFEHRHDIGVAQPAGGLRSADQQIGHQWIGRLAQRVRLDRDFAVELGVAGQINHALGTAAENAQHAEFSDEQFVTDGLCC